MICCIWATSVWRAVLSVSASCLSYSASYCAFDHRLSLDAPISLVVRTLSSEVGSGSPTQSQMNMSKLALPGGSASGGSSSAPSLASSWGAALTLIPSWPNQSTISEAAVASSGAPGQAKGDLLVVLVEAPIRRVELVARGVELGLGGVDAERPNVIRLGMPARLERRDLGAAERGVPVERLGDDGLLVDCIAERITEGRVLDRRRGRPTTLD